MRRVQRIVQLLVLLEIALRQLVVLLQAVALASLDPYSVQQRLWDLFSSGWVECPSVTRHSQVLLPCSLLVIYVCESAPRPVLQYQE